MRKSLFAIGLLAVSYSVQAQNVLCHVDTNANMYVSEGTLVYSGGGVQTRGNGLLDVHGNVMVVGTATDSFKTVDTGGADKTDGGNIVLRLNTPSSYATSTYGQLYVDGLSQSNVTGTVTKEYRNAKHGNGNFYQQIGLPFSDKVLSSLSGELNKTFSNTRYSKNEILAWNNATVVSDTKPITSTTSTATAYNYYMLGSSNNNLDLSTPPGGANAVFNINGKPFSTLATATLMNAGNGIDFGPGGNNRNSYNERYNSYAWDQFEETNSLWAGTFGKNIYEFGNPFLTNLDLSRIGYVENGGVTDGNAIGNIWGIQYSPGTVQYVNNVGSTFTNPLTITFDINTHVPVGDVNNLIVKPMGVFVMKLRDNSSQTLNFNTLRRFSNTARAAGTDYNVNASRSALKSSNSTVKQLGVIGLDAAGNEVARVYYVVTPNATTGHQISNATTLQVATDNSNSIITYEEALNGGQDPNYSGQYKLYINEANESNFLGKNIVMDNFDYGTAGQRIVSYKFEIRENAEMIPAGVHQLSSGTGFYYKSANGNPEEAKQGAIVPVGSKIYNLYYGEPDRGTLAANDTTKALSKTVVVYNPAVSNYIVRFDPSWKKADIEVYDMSGKLIISKKAVDASRDFVIELDGSVKSSYVVKVVSDKGVIVNTKILK